MPSSLVVLLAPVEPYSTVMKSGIKGLLWQPWLGHAGVEFEEVLQRVGVFLGGADDVGGLELIGEVAVGEKEVGGDCCWVDEPGNGLAGRDVRFAGEEDIQSVLLKRFRVIIRKLSERK